MNSFKKVSIVSLLMLVSGFLLLVAPRVYAATPNLSLSATGNGDSVQITVVGDPNTSVILDYMKLGSGSAIQNIGTTNSSGNFSIVISSSQYGISSNSIVYVTTGGINGSQSNQATWPSVSSSGSSSLTLSQSAELLQVGQTASITSNISSLFLSNNSSPSVANVNPSGSQINITANTAGSTLATICSTQSTSLCASVYVLVQNSTTQQLSFNQNNISVFSGQTVPVIVSGGSGIYTILNNSNPNSIQASISGSVVNFTTSATIGSSSVIVCTTDMQYCGVINATVSGTNATSISFSQSAPVLYVGQTTTVTMYGPSGSTFYLPSNSNPNIVQASVSGNVLTLTGESSGYSILNVCPSIGSCGSLDVDVNYANGSAALTLSQNNLSIAAGQSVNVIISGGTMPYSLSSNPANIFQSTLSASTLTIYGVTSGSSSINICSLNASCTTLYVNVGVSTFSGGSLILSPDIVSLAEGQQTTIYIEGNGGYYLSSNTNPTDVSISVNQTTAVVSALGIGTSNVSICQAGGQCSTLMVTVTNPTTLSGYPVGCASTLGFSPITGQSCSAGSATGSISLGSSTVSLALGQQTTVAITGSGSYYVSTNVSPSIASVSVSGSSVIVTAEAVGSDTISICQSTGQCASLSVSVNSTAAGTTTTSAPYVFTRYLGYGDVGADVLFLQQYLVQKGFLTATPTGRYGPATIAAVKKFQQAHSLSQVGVVGPATKTALNQLQIPLTQSSATTSNQTQAAQIEQEIQQLQSQLTGL